MKVKPPKILSWLLRKVISKDVQYSAIGDFDEIYAEKAKDKGFFQAKMWYGRQILKSLPLFAKDTIYWSVLIFKSYLKIALRNVIRHKSYSFINIFGLVIGFSSCIIIFLFVQSELSYDSFHENAERIYRVTTEKKSTNNHWIGAAPAVGHALMAEFPEVLKAVRFRYSNDHVMSYEDKQFYENKVIYVDSTFFDIFSFPLRFGNQNTALREPNSIVITREIAQKYFGEDNAIGRTLKLDGNLELQVTGVLESVPRNSHLAFDFLISFVTFKVPAGYTDDLTSWEWFSFHTYILMNEGADPGALEEKLPDFLRKNTYPQFAAQIKLRLEKLSNIYFSPITSNVTASGNITFVYVLSGIAFIILIVAAFNFTNLSIVHSIKRGKEIGIRKVLGAYRRNVAQHFLVESIMYSFVGLLIAIFAAASLLPWLNPLFNVSISIDSFFYSTIFPLFLMLSIVIGIIAGSYPALVVSRFQPGIIFQGRLKVVFSGLQLRHVLVTLQFTFTIGLIASCIVILNQMEFIKNRYVGFNKEQIIILNMPGDQLEARYDYIRNSLLELPEVINVSASRYMLDGDSGSLGVLPEGASRLDSYQMNVYGVKFDFFETLDIRFIEGRSFSKAFGSDSTRGIIINKAAAEMFPWEEPLGKRLQLGMLMVGRVVGVTENFHFESLHNRVAPLALYISKANVENVFVRVRLENVQNVLTNIRNTWAGIVPDFPFQYTFLDENVDRFYLAENQLLRLIFGFSILAIVIACLGLYGIVSFNAQQRIKEISIRKVLGASVPRIMLILSDEFLKVIVIANILAWPLTYFLINIWLQSFAYHVELQLSTFLIAFVITLLLAKISIGFKSAKAAVANPVNALRNE